VKQTPRRAPQPSKTLMRHAVKQPGSLKPAAAKHSHLSHRPKADILPKPSVSHIEPSRLLHARSVKKSRAISRFSSSVFDYQALPANSLPAERPKLAMASRPVIASERSTTDLLERAIQRAESHRQSHPRTKRRISRKISNLTASALAVVLLAGFFAYQNAASIAIHQATGKVGFAASLPGYKPSGFSLGRAVYSTGYFQVNFHSNSDQRSFAIVERPSVINNQPFSIDGQHNASWIRNGIAYEVQANGSLSDEQLQQLANSL